jgi:hypothetical protein
VQGVIVVLGLTVALAAAGRSTWSPCGLSMLSTLTPFGERSRGHRYAGTAAWYLAGAVLGGLTLGAVSAGLAALLAFSGLRDHPGWTVAIVVVAAWAAAAADFGVFGDLIPIWRRQVDDGWLSRYRRWVYAAGFGWQIGVGLATYVMTAAVFLLVVLAVISGDPVVAVVVGTVFGVVRGTAVFLTARADTPARLRALHRRIDQAGPTSRAASIVVEVLVGVAVVAVQWPLAGAATGLAMLGLALFIGVAAGRGRIGRGRIGRGRAGQALVP